VKTLNGGLDPSIGKDTQFKPGESPNPAGRPPTKPVLEAMRAALAENPELLSEIVLNACTRAKKTTSDFREFREILDGKTGSEIEGSADGRSIVHNLNIRFVDPRNKH
jgi:hypothetical protein